LKWEPARLRPEGRKCSKESIVKGKGIRQGYVAEKRFGGLGVNRREALAKVYQVLQIKTLSLRK